MNKMAMIINPDELLSLPNIVNRALENNSMNLINDFRNESLFNYGYAVDVGTKELMEILHKEKYE